MPADTSPAPDENNKPFQPNQTWLSRFVVSCTGIILAVRTEVSLVAHLFVAAAVLLAGAVLGISRWEWCLILLCITMVLSAELFNTSIERLARAITREENPIIRDALDIASGAVLVVVFGAVIIGGIVFGTRVVGLWVS